jgi:predicted RNase H-like HicB family nuclease
LRYTVILEKGREAGFVAICPALPGCVSQGRTRRDVLRNIREAVEVYIEALLEDGLPVPVEQGRQGARPPRPGFRTRSARAVPAAR